MKARVQQIIQENHSPLHEEEHKDDENKFHITLDDDHSNGSTI